MKKVIFLILFIALVTLPCIFAQKDADREVARTQEFIAATTQKGKAKVDALSAYIKKFPETSSRWTRLAHYHLSLGYFELKNYAKAVEFAQKTIKIGSLQPGEEGRLLLILGNGYGIKNTSIFNQEKALEYTKKAISFSKANKLKDVQAEAEKLKSKLSGPPPKKISPEQQIKMNYSDEDYTAAISFYQKLGAADKANFEIHKVYANALFKAKQYTSALKEFKSLYSKNKKAIFALRIAEIYSDQARRNKSLFDSAVNYYLEASVLYGKEGNSANQKIAYKKAEFQLFEKYGFNKKVDALAKQHERNKASAEKNESALRKLKYDLRKLQRDIKRNYESQDLDPPQYMKDKVKELQKKISSMESGVTPQATDEAAKLEKEKMKILDELKQLLEKAKKRLE